MWDLFGNHIVGFPHKAAQNRLACDRFSIPGVDVHVTLLLQVLVLCFAVFLGSWSPTSLNIGYSTSKPTYTQPAIYPQTAKPSPFMGPPIEGARVDAYCTPNSK